MTLMQYVTAYVAVQSLMERETDYGSALALLLLKRKLEPQAQFFAQKEQELVNRYAARKKDGTIEWTSQSTFAFAEPEKAAEYAAERAKLGSTVGSKGFKRVKLKAPERLTPAQLEALEPFVEFEEADA